jgi:2-polyprenyl-3-methyl-5-hydroxy-6-metoxy-1,4-benzoquinol methylase
MLITDSYRELNKDLHAQGMYGRKGDKWTAKVASLIEQFKPRCILDYGCGQGALGRALGVQVAEYDPAIPGKDKEPEPADLVICTDVLEHIEPECLDAVLDHLRGLTKSVLFAVVSTRPAKKFLSDGRNAHLIVEPWTFWQEKLSSRFDIGQTTVHHKEVEVELHARQ